MNDTINITELMTVSNWSFEESVSKVITTNDLLALCGAMDRNALVLAGVGLFLAFSYLVFVRRFRDKMSEKHRVLLDKAFLTAIMMLFVGIIIRVMRAG